MCSKLNDETQANHNSVWLYGRTVILPYKSVQLLDPGPDAVLTYRDCIYTHTLYSSADLRMTYNKATYAQHSWDWAVVWLVRLICDSRFHERFHIPLMTNYEDFTIKTVNSANFWQPPKLLAANEDFGFFTSIYCPRPYNTRGSERKATSEAFTMSS